MCISPQVKRTSLFRFFRIVVRRGREKKRNEREEERNRELNVRVHGCVHCRRMLNLNLHLYFSNSLRLVFFCMARKCTKIAYVCTICHENAFNFRNFCNRPFYITNEAKKMLYHTLCFKFIQFQAFSFSCIQKLWNSKVNHFSCQLHQFSVFILFRAILHHVQSISLFLLFCAYVSDTIAVYDLN